MRFRRRLSAGALTIGYLAMTAAPAEAAEAIVAADCTALVRGVAGQPVLLETGAVLDPVLGALRPLDPLGLLTGPVRDSWLAQAPLPVGTVPDGEVVVSGAEIADVAVGRLASIPVVATVLTPLTGTVRSVLGSACGLLVQQVEPEVPGTAEPAPPGATGPPPSQPAGGTTPLTPSGGRLVTQPAAGGTAARFGFADPLPFGPSLNYGAPGAMGAPGVPVAVAGKKDVVSTQRSTGTAEALPMAADQLSKPVLLATLALTLAAGQLVRTWIRRGKYSA